MVTTLPSFCLRFPNVTQPSSITVQLLLPSFEDGMALWLDQNTALSQSGFQIWAWRCFQPNARLLTSEIYKERKCVQNEKPWRGEDRHYSAQTHTMRFVKEAIMGILSPAELPTTCSCMSDSAKVIWSKRATPLIPANGGNCAKLLVLSSRCFASQQQITETIILGNTGCSLFLNSPLHLHYFLCPCHIRRN